MSNPDLQTSLAAIDESFATGDKCAVVRLDHYLLLRGEIERLEAENDALRVERDESLAWCERMAVALGDAGQSLITISGLAGKDEYMNDFIQVRGYANSRATVVAEVLSESKRIPLTKFKAQGAREALEVARGGKWVFSNTLVAVADIQAAIADMENDSE